MATPEQCGGSRTNDVADPDPASYGVADPDLNFSFKATGSVSPL